MSTSKDRVEKSEEKFYMTSPAPNRNIVPEGMVRKTILIPANVHDALQEYVNANPGIGFSFIANQAFNLWLHEPRLEALKPARGFSAERH